MKKIIFIAAVAAAGLATYLFMKKRKPGNPVAKRKPHHLTDAFSKAKKYAM